MFRFNVELYPCVWKFCFDRRFNLVAPSEMVEMWESLLDDYDLAVYYLGQDGISSPTDAQIYNKMLSVVLIATTIYGGDFSNFRREGTIRTGMT